MRIFKTNKGGVNIGSVVSIVIGVVILFAIFGGLYSTFTTSVDDLNDTLGAQGTSTTSARTIINLMKWIFPLGIGVGILYLILRKTALGGGWG